MSNKIKTRRPTQKRNKIGLATPSNRMVWGLLGTAAVILLGVIAWFVTPKDSGPEGFEPEVTGAPRVAMISEEAVDYGDVELNTTIETVFRVKNVGDKDLRIAEEPFVELVQGC